MLMLGLAPWSLLPSQLLPWARCQPISARAQLSLQVMGLLQGKVQGDAFVVIDSFALPVEGTETRVNAQAEAYEYMVDFQGTSKVSICSQPSCCRLCVNSDCFPWQPGCAAAGPATLLSTKQPLASFGFACSPSHSSHKVQHAASPAALTLLTAAALPFSCRWGHTALHHSPL